MWSKSEDEQLISMVKGGMTYGQIAEVMTGRSRSSLIGRYSRLVGTKFPSQLKRASRDREQMHERRRERELARARLVERVRALLATGMKRNQAIAQARQEGATLGDIGGITGLSRQRIHQILSLQGEQAA
jgi:hypothetical protein